MKPLYFLLVNGNILAAFTILHMYWLIGGRSSIKYFLPTKSKFVKRNAKPNMLVLLIKTVALAVMSWFCFIQIIAQEQYLTPEVILWGNRAISVIFIIRAIGNFTYVGFTKTFKDSIYATLDTFIYSPLCLLLAVSSWITSIIIFTR